MILFSNLHEENCTQYLVIIYKGKNLKKRYICMYTYIYVYMYTYTHTYIYTHLMQEEILAEVGMILGNWFP